MNKTTEHLYVIRFLEKTILQPAEEGGPVIQLQQFMVRTYDHLKLLANTRLKLPDVVGCIKSVKGYGLTDPNVFAPILIRLLIGPHRVELLIDDGTNYATLSVAYKDIFKLTGKSAYNLLADEVNGDAGNDRPGALEKLRGRAYMFHVIVADKFMSRTCPFTVCGMSDLIGDAVQQLPL
ncbi:unnamed protein product [Cochlearia groenlandica]